MRIEGAFELDPPPDYVSKVVQMRFARMLIFCAALATLPPCPVSASGKGAPSFGVELTDFPSVIEHGQSLEGRVRIENRSEQGAEFKVQTYVNTAYGPAALLSYVHLAVDAGSSGETPLVVPSGGLDPGEYEVTIAVRHEKDILIVPLRFRVT